VTFMTILQCGGDGLEESVSYNDDSLYALQSELHR